MKIISTIIILLISQISFGRDYLGYHEKINEARQLSIDSNFLQSALVYKETFDEYEFKYARDCINAFEVSTNLINDSLTFYFLESCLKKGVSISYFDTNKKIERFRTTPFWSSIVENISIYKKEYQSNINYEIREEINKMFEDDQRIREKYYKWSNLLLRPIIHKKWKELNAKQVERIIEITKSHGFPGERLIGIDLPKYHKKIDSLQFSAGMPIILFIHHYSQPNISFDSILLVEVFKGNLNNEHFATICDFEAEFGKNKFNCFGYYGLRHKPQNYTFNEFKEKRKAVGLLSESEIQKLNKTKIMTKFWNQLK